MDSQLGSAVLLFHFFRALLYFPLLIALGIVVWKPLDWMGLNRIDPRHIIKLKQLLWILLLSFFLVFIFMLFGQSMFWRYIDFRAADILGKTEWLNNFWKHILQIFILCGVKMLVGWFFSGGVCWYFY